jgi:hypothetical protein
MVGIGQKYASLVHDVTDYWGAYLPNVPVSVGDYVEFQSDGAIRRLGTSFDWPGWQQQFPVETQQLDGASTFDSHAKRSHGAEAGGGVTGPGGVGADAAISLSFSAEAGFVLDYQAAALHRYRDIETVRRWLLALAKKGEWEPHQALVTEVIEAGAATVVMSREKSSNVVLHAGASLPSGIGALNLSDPKLGLTVTSTSGSTLISLCKQSTPLFRIVRVRKSWLRRWHAELQAVSDDPHPAEAFSDDPFGTEDEPDV